MSAKHFMRVIDLSPRLGKAEFLKRPDFFQPRLRHT